ncbi:hypothetical protein [Haloarchaeobius litoreus]|uniref:Uncharacterized protein n=1 Tax=Haloarchaeobius litoreus TaxID=755306 RepID=A0ABD6DK44_9EURY|nr:hypothetical protein [Haloarchaeobius litoreus]
MGAAIAADLVLQQTTRTGHSTMVVVAAAVAALVVGIGAGVLGARLLGGSGDSTSAGAPVSRFAQPLSTEPDANAVYDELTSLTKATDSVLRAAGDTSAVSRGDSRSEALTSLSRALSRGDLHLTEQQPGAAADAGAGGPGAADGVTGGGPQPSDGPPVDAVATEIRSSHPPSAPAARDLLDTLSEPNARRGDTHDTLDRAVVELDRAHRVTEAAERAGNVRGPDQARTFDDRLHEVDGPLASALRPVSSRLVDALADLDETRSSQSANATVLADVCDRAERDTTVSLRGGDTAARGDDLVERLERGDLSFSTGETGVASVAASVESRQSPESAAAVRLLDELKTSATTEEDSLRAALRTATGALDEHAATRQLVSGVDRDSVTELANSVKRDLDPSDPVESALLERVADLQGELDRAGQSDLVRPYVVRQELSFYRDTLLPTLSSTRSDATATETPSRLVERVGDRIGEVEEYYELRDDHNHTIPRHFVSLARSLHDEGERLAPRDPERAKGTLEATLELLDATEQLYERNQFSIMLRRLRGS